MADGDDKEAVDEANRSRYTSVVWAYLLRYAASRECFIVMQPAAQRLSIFPSADPKLDAVAFRVFHSASDSGGDRQA